MFLQFKRNLMKRLIQFFGQILFFRYVFIFILALVKILFFNHIKNVNFSLIKKLKITFYYGFNLIIPKKIIRCIIAIWCFKDIPVFSVTFFQKCSSGIPLFRHNL